MFISLADAAADVAAAATPVPKLLIVCADDFALHSSASTGIAALAQQRHISATSVMVLSPRWAKDVALLQPLRGQIDVGLHLDWTSDFARVLGHGVSLAGAMRRAWLGGFDQALARLVIECQLDLFEAHWQAPPDHVDGHQHVQQFSGIRQALLEVLARRYGHLARKPYVRLSRPASSRASFSLTGADCKSRVIAAMGATALQRLASAAGMATAPALLGVYAFDAAASAYARLMQGWLAQAPAGAIIMCHPAQDVANDDAIAAARVQEFLYLRSAQFASALQASGVVLARGQDCL